MLALSVDDVGGTLVAVAAVTGTGAMATVVGRPDASKIVTVVDGPGGDPFQ